MAHQSLYRRYRPRRFDEVRGQEHVIAALRNAVRNQTEGHAYLFSGPRGTGKTSTARILAKALNCENPQNGEPCCDCTPCMDMEAGRSFDLFELDAASNNGVDAVRDLIERAAVGSPGRTKVYILDEVHMLTAAGSNALLKTLEEPPDHVRFVLATTDPQKVLPTIRSRTQHFEFQLLSAQELEAQVRWIAADADLDVDDEAVAWVVQKGRGSSRDTLSALDQVVAAGGVVTRAEPVEQLYEALAERSPGRAVSTIADALAQGHDPRVLGGAFLESLRDAFLVSLAVEAPHLVDHDRQRLERWATQLGTPMLTRSMEALGSALVEMRQAADPRVPLEVAMVRLCSADDTSTAGLLARIERLEQALASGLASPPTASSPSAVSSTAASPTAPGGSTAARPTAEPSSTPSPPVESRDQDSTGGSSSGSSGASGPAMARAELARRRAARDGGSDNDAAEVSRKRPERAAPPPVPGAPPPVPGSAATPERPVAAPPQPAPTQDAPEPSPRAEPDAEPTPVATAESVPTSGPAPGSVPGPGPGPGSTEAAAAASGALDVERLSAALAAVLSELRAPAKAACQDGSFVAVEGSSAVFELGLGVPQRHAERFRADVQAALSEHLGAPLALEFVPSGESPTPTSTKSSSAVGAPGAEMAGAAGETDDPDEVLEIDISELEDADVAETSVDRLTRAFPGAVVVDTNEVNS